MPNVPHFQAECSNNVSLQADVDALQYDLRQVAAQWAKVARQVISMRQRYRHLPETVTAELDAFINQCIQDVYTAELPAEAAATLQAIMDAEFHLLYGREMGDFC